MNRRTFLARTLVTATAAMLTRSELSAAEIAPEAGRGPGRGPRSDLQSVLDFVQAGHRDLTKVEAMVARDPSLLHARWDWGEGDWESALEGAAHMGRADIVTYLISQGARIDSFSAAMLGHTEAVKALLDLNPATATTRGPHGLPLMFYVGHGGQVAMAAAVVPHLENAGDECNRALHTATLSNHVDLVEWLIRSGATDINTTNCFGKTPLDAAIERKFTRLANVLRQHGGKSSGD